MTYDLHGDRHYLGSNAGNFERVNTDDTDNDLTATQRFAIFTIAAMCGVAFTLMFGLAVNAWLAKAAFLHANPLVGQPW